MTKVDELQPHPVKDQLPGVDFCINSYPPWRTPLSLSLSLSIALFFFNPYIWVLGFKFSFFFWSFFILFVLEKKINKKPHGVFGNTV